MTNGLIQLTLDEYCNLDRDCPRTVEGAHRDVTGCGEGEYSEETTGCGYVVVTFYGDGYRRGFVFEDNTLVGAYSQDNDRDTPCDTSGEVGGVYPPRCIGAASCRICDQEDGAAGAGPFCDSEGGAGGQGGGAGEGP